MLKYIQTQIPVPQFKRLKIEALDRNISLGDLLQEIISKHIEKTEKEAITYGNSRKYSRSKKAKEAQERLV